ncbi:hypothetical protein LRP88_05046 [Fusarium phalaenopsidis]
MANKVFLAAVAADVLFLASGILELVFSLVVRSQMNDAPQDGEQATRNLLHQRFPLTAGIVNAAFILATFAVTLPGLVMPARSILKISGYMVTFCAIFTMCVGVFLWVMTLRIREQFFDIYIAQEPEIQSLIQISVLLRILQQYHTRLCHGHYVHQPCERSSSTRLRDSHLQLLKPSHRQHLYRCLWTCWC